MAKPDLKNIVLGGGLGRVRAVKKEVLLVTGASWAATFLTFLFTKCIADPRPLPLHPKRLIFGDRGALLKPTSWEPKHEHQGFNILTIRNSMFES